jgi:MoxR-like ATPase
MQTPTLESTPPAVAGEITVQEFREAAAALEAEVGKVIVGQSEVVRHVLICLIAGGHALLEGVPGLGKTMLIRTLGEALRLNFARIQFTPDLMPADIVGTDILEEAADGRREFRFQPGPIFANLVLADEINRATPKTQSALLEAMQEHSVTVAKRTYRLEEPFFVLATQNPIEMEGTYPLPEAQLDRFLFKVNVGFPSSAELVEILARTTGRQMPTAGQVVDGARMLAMGALARQIPVASHVADFVARLVVATHPDSAAAPPLVKQYVRYGASPRGAQALILGAKITALFAGRLNVAFEDVAAVAPAALRHRLLLNFEGQAEGVTTDAIVKELLEKVVQKV